MADFLNYIEIKSILGRVIIGGIEECVRPNSYILRLGDGGAFLQAGEEYQESKIDKGKQHRGVRISPGQSVAMRALEIVDFKRETVESIFPGYDLLALISPTTDLSREGIVASTTQVDAGYHGTLHWTVVNTSNAEQFFTYQDRILRLTIMKLSSGERPPKYM